jgi:hypothetical protein
MKHWYRLGHDIDTGTGSNLRKWMNWKCNHVCQCCVGVGHQHVLDTRHAFD